MSEQPASSKSLGKAGEAAARRKLESLGYEILESNFRVREGEVDLVARDGGEYVFVEVKARRGRAYGIPEESVTAVKQERLATVARSYLERLGEPDAEWRIDVVAIEHDSRGRIARLEVLRNVVADPDQP